jgi:hypothetical protein
VGEKAPYRSEDLDCLISFPTFRHACRSWHQFSSSYMYSTCVWKDEWW